VKDVRPVLVNQDACLVIVIVGIAADVRPLVTNQDLLARVRRQALRDRRAGKAGANHQIIEHGSPVPG
jgi:hypothetical protein